MQGLNPKVKNVLSTIGNFLSTFITAVVAIVAFIFILIKLFGWNMFSIDSPSMSPKYPVDALVIVQKIDPSEIKVGDVITYVLNEDGVLVTHRVTQINESKQFFITKGDVNKSEDVTPVLWGNIVGKVFLCIPGLGKPLRVLTNEKNRIFVIIFIALMFTLSLVWDIIERKNKKNKEKNNFEEPLLKREKIPNDFSEKEKNSR